jgi:putative SOS response-associated peptidase YedK
VVRPVHDRMPVTLPSGDFAAWPNPRTAALDLHSLLRPYPTGELAAAPASSYVNGPRNQGPQCLAP